MHIHIGTRLRASWAAKMTGDLDVEWGLATQKPWGDLVIQSCEKQSGVTDEIMYTQARSISDTVP